MNILHVVDQMSLSHGGGVAMCVYKLSEAQTKLGHKVSVYTTDWKMNGQAPPALVNLRAFPLSGTPLGVRVSLNMLWSRIPRDTIVHIHDYRGFPELVFAGHRPPVVFEAHGSLPFQGSDLLSRTFESIFRRVIFNHAQRYIAQSGIEEAQYLDYGADKDRVRLIAPGIDWAEFKTLPPRNEQPYKTILYLGRLNKIKGIDDLILAFRDIVRQDMRLVIVGPDDGWELYLRWLAGDDPRITFTGPLYGKEKIQAYVDADVYVLPSRYEIFGLTIIEALACGTPVLITTKQGMSDMLPDFCGLVTDDLRSGLETVLDRERTELGNEVRRDFAHAFAWDRVALSHLKVYEEVMG